MNLRPTYCKINLKNVQENFSRLKKIRPVIGVVKANAYGHGAVQISKVLEKNRAKFLMVATIEEGIKLRKAGIKTPILIGGSIYPFTNFKEIVRHRLIPTIASLESAKAFNSILKEKYPVHIKVDTGMNRIGLKIENALPKILEISEMKNIKIQGIYMHLPSADFDRKLTLEQGRKFLKLKKELFKRKVIPAFFHASNSAALRFPSLRFDLVRPGLAIYGLKPYDGFSGYKPVLSFHTKIVFLKRIKKGEKVSYGGTWRAKRDSKIATLPVGYADGIRRELSNRGFVLIRGKRFPVVGRVCMDMTIIDVTDLKNPRIGEDVTIIGKNGREQISAEEIAKLCGTINYEIVCGISGRVPRIYV